MNEDQVKGKLKEAAGTVQRKWGEATDDPKDQVEGAKNEVKGKIQQVKGDLKEAIRDAK